MALVLVMGVVALISAWAIAAVRDDWGALQRADNAQLTVRVRLAAESGLAWARATLLATPSPAGSPQASASVTPVELHLDDIRIAVSIEDTGRYFNLNDLVNGQGVAQPEAVAIAKRLFAQLEIPPQLVDAVVDWIDSDSTPFGSGGIESLPAGMPYQVKNAPLDRLDELLLVPGFDTAMLSRLRRVATALPGMGMTPVNINTAPAEVLRSLGENLDAGDISELLSRRDSSPYASVAEATAQLPSLRTVNALRLAVRGERFRIRSTARLKRARWGEEMVLDRSQSRGRVVLRQRLVSGT